MNVIEKLRQKQSMLLVLLEYANVHVIHEFTTDVTFVKGFVASQYTCGIWFDFDGKRHCVSLSYVYESLTYEGFNYTCSLFTKPFTDINSFIAEIKGIIENEQKE